MSATTRIIFSDDTAVDVAADVDAVREAFRIDHKRGEPLSEFMGPGDQPVFVAGERVAYLQPLKLSHHDDNDDSLRPLEKSS